MDILYKDESYRIMGACFEVYKQKGCGFVEPVYQECLSLELGMQNIPFAEQLELPKPEAFEISSIQKQLIIK